MPLSALTGDRCDALLERLDDELSNLLLGTYEYTITLKDGKAIAWLYANGQITHHEEDKKDELIAHYHVRLSPANAARFNRLFNY